MSEGSKIQWCDDTHNFWRGCVKVSPGCTNCYAEVSTPVRVARSEGRELWGGTLRDKAKDFEAPLRWNEKPWVCDGCGHAQSHVDYCDKCKLILPVATLDFHRRRVFSLSLGDWLDEAVPIEWLAEMLDVIRRCPNLDFLLLTKRPQNWLGRIQAVLRHLMFYPDYTACRATWAFLNGWLNGHAPANVWIGTTVENQEYADKRIPELLKIPAACRFVSYEPALGPVRFVSEVLIHASEDHPDMVGFMLGKDDGKSGLKRSAAEALSGLNWIIVGGESGPKARPFNIEWARSTVAQCKAAGVACFVKQMGAVPFGTERNMNSNDPNERLPFKIGHLDKKGGEMAEWPEDLRVRQFPMVAQRTGGGR